MLFITFIFFFYMGGMLSAEMHDDGLISDIRICSDLTYDVYNGLYNALYSHRSLDIGILNNFRLSSSSERWVDCCSLRTIKLGLDFSPFEILTAKVLFFISKFPEYSIEENNLQLIISPDLITQSPDVPFNLSVSAGFNFRRIKFDGTEYNLTPEMKPLIENFVLWEVMTGFNPFDEMYMKFRIGNLGEYNVNNINYWEFAPSLFYKMTEELSLIVSGGVSIVGALPLAAHPWRRWVAIGSEYVY